jgi:hypothetical protein
MSFSAYSANRILDGDTIDHSALWVQVHTARPGPNGTTAVSTASPTRVSATFGVAGAVLTNTTGVDLASDGSGVNTIRFCSLWDAESGGNCIYTNGAVAPALTFTAGDEVSIGVGALVVTLVVGSA